MTQHLFPVGARRWSSFGWRRKFSNTPLLSWRCWLKANGKNAPICLSLSLFLSFSPALSVPQSLHPSILRRLPRLRPLLFLLGFGLFLFSSFMLSLARLNRCFVLGPSNGPASWPDRLRGVPKCGKLRNLLYSQRFMNPCASSEAHKNALTNRSPFWKGGGNNNASWNESRGRIPSVLEFLRRLYQGHHSARETDPHWSLRHTYLLVGERNNYVK